MKRLLFVFILLHSITVSGQSTLEDGRWHADLQLNDSVNLGFILITNAGTITIENATERIALTDIRTSGDSIVARFPFYDAELRFINLGMVCDVHTLARSIDGAEVFERKHSIATEF